MKLNEQTIFILGRPNFWCNSIARRMRELGHEIQNKAEDEQAHVINLMLEHYEDHGDEWRDCLESYLRSGERLKKLQPRHDPHNDHHLYQGNEC